MYIGDFNTGATVKVFWNTNGADGSSITRATDGTLRVYKGTSDTQRSSLAGVTQVEDFDSLTGVHTISIDLSDNTDSGFYAAGNDYFLVYAAMTIDGKTVNHAIAHFSVENRNTIKTPNGPYIAIRIAGNGTTRTYYTAASDTDAARGTAILAAQTAASSGDTIYVYGNCSIGTALGKNGVNWWFDRVTITSTGTSKVFSDGAATMAFNVYGHGRFVSTDANVFHLEGNGSLWNIECDSVKAFGAGKSACIAATGEVYIRIKGNAESNEYDVFWAQANGLINFDCYDIIAGDSPIEVAGEGATIIGRCRYASGATMSISTGAYVALTADRIYGIDPVSPLPVITIDPDATGYIKCPHIQGIITDGGSGVRIIGALIDSSGVAGYPTIILAGTGLSLENSRLLTHFGQTNSVSADPASELKILGTFESNKAIENTVTLDYAAVRADNRNGEETATEETAQKSLRVVQTNSRRT